MTPPRRLAVCADDYGQGAAIDRGILALALALLIQRSLVRIDLKTVFRATLATQFALGSAITIVARHL